MFITDVISSCGDVIRGFGEIISYLPAELLVVGTTLFGFFIIYGLIFMFRR